MNAQENNSSSFAPSQSGKLFKVYYQHNDNIRKFRIANEILNDYSKVRQRVFEMGKFEPEDRFSHIQLQFMPYPFESTVNESNMEILMKVEPIANQNDWEMVLIKLLSMPEDVVPRIGCIVKKESSFNLPVAVTQTIPSVVNRFWSGLNSWTSPNRSTRSSISTDSANVVRVSSIPMSCDKSQTNVDQRLEQMRIMTFNVRFDTIVDGINQWSFRSKGVGKRLSSYRLDILCLQEALEHQEKDILQAMNENKYMYSAISRGREYDEKTGKFFGEATSIIYNNERYQSLAEGFFWLSETPDKPGSKGWDADCVRILTWTVLKPTATNQNSPLGDEPFLLFNTHLDHLGKKARWNSVVLIKQRIHSIINKLKPKISVKRVLFSADCNCESDTAEFQELLKPDEEAGLRLAFCDTRHPDEKLSTYTGWFDESSLVLDHILISDPSPSSFNAKYKVVTDHLPPWDNGLTTPDREKGNGEQTPFPRKMSDHRPILVTFSSQH